MKHRITRLLMALALLLCAGPVQAQFLLLGVGKPVAASGFSVTWKGSDDKALGSTSYTFSAITVGAADTHRLIVVNLAAVAGSGLGIPTVNINSNPATCFITDNGSSRVFMTCELVVTTGTTATVDATFSVSVSRASIDVWSVLNANGDTHSNISSAAPPSNGASPLAIAALTIANPTNGAVICGARSATTGVAYAWSQSAGSAGSINSDHTNGTTIEMSAYTIATPGATPVTYTVTQTGATLIRAACVAFKP